MRKNCRTTVSDKSYAGLSTAAILSPCCSTAYRINSGKNFNKTDLNQAATLDAKAAYSDAGFVVIAALTNG